MATINRADAMAIMYKSIIKAQKEAELIDSSFLRYMSLESLVDPEGYKAKWLELFDGQSNHHEVPAQKVTTEDIKETFPDWTGKMKE